MADKTRFCGKYELRYIMLEVTDCGRTYYSFSIEQRSDDGIESDFVDDVCDTLDEALALFERMYDEAIMPASLFAVAEDYIYKKSCPDDVF